MKIAFLINDITPAAGTERITTTLCNSFATRGHDIYIISCYKEFANTSYDLDPKIKIIFVNNFEKPKENLFVNIAGYLKQINKIRRILTANNFDLIIGQSFPMNFILFFAGQHRSIIACEHSFYDYYSFPVKCLRRFLYKSLARVVVLTENDKVLFNRHLSHVSTIPNMNLFYSDSKADITRKRIISVGRLEYAKGFDLLIDSVKDIFKEYPDWELSIWGVGDLEEKLAKQISMLRLENNVFLRGRTTNIKDEYLKSSVYVMSSRFEGFGLVLVEAAACGLPIISFDCPNGPGDVLANDCGLLVENGNPEALKKTILKLIQDEQLRQAYSVKGEQIVKKYSEEIIYEKWENLFTSLRQ